MHRNYGGISYKYWGYYATGGCIRIQYWGIRYLAGEFWGRATRSVLGVGDQILAAASTLWSGFHRRRRCITACEGCSWCTQTCGPSLPYLSSRGCFALWQVSSRLSTASRDSALRRFVFAFRLHAAPAKAPPDAAIIEPTLDAATAEAKRA